MCCEMVAKVLNMFKNFMRFFVHASVANMSPRNVGEFTMRKLRDTRKIVVRMPLDRRATVLATIWRENKTKRHSYEFRETLSRMSRDCRTNENETKATFVGRS